MLALTEIFTSNAGYLSVTKVHFINGTIPGNLKSYWMQKVFILSLCCWF